MLIQGNSLVSNGKANVDRKLKMLFVFASILALSLFQLINDNILWSIFCFILIWFISLTSIKFDVLHPYVWFIPIFTIYSVGYPLYLMVNDSLTFFDIRVLQLEWLALCVFILVVGNKQIKYDFKNYVFNANSIIPKLLLFACAIMSLIYILLVIQSGVTSKMGVVSSSNPLILLGNMFVNFTPVPLSYIILNPKVNNKNKILLYLFFLLIQLLNFAVNGQRAIIISFLFFGVMIYNLTIRKINRKTFLMLLTAGILLITILADFKMVLMRGYPVSSNDTEFINKLLSSEFQTSSQNLNYLLSVKDTWNYKYGSTLIYDILAPIDFLLPVDINRFSAINWYQSTYFAQSNSGQAFTLVGEGYINFGVLGVVIWYILIGLLVKAIYYKSSNSRNWLILYLLLIIQIMYSNRADLANIFSPLFKYGLLPLWLFSLTLRQKNATLNYKRMQESEN